MFIVSVKENVLSLYPGSKFDVSPNLMIHLGWIQEFSKGEEGVLLKIVRPCPRGEGVLHLKKLFSPKQRAGGAPPTPIH